MDDAMPERWLPVVGYEGFYEVSDLGRVRSLPRLIVCRNGHTRNWPGKVLSPYISPKDGYQRTPLSVNGVKTGPLLVHRLVAEAFLGECPEGQEVRHLDGDPGNNVLTNLVYGTHAENMQDMLRHGTHHWTNVTHCPQGHAYSDDNTLVSGGRRYCRQCWRKPRSEWIPHHNARKTHCDSDHEFTPENTYTRAGKRSCRTCRRRWAQEARERRAASRAC